MFWKEAIIHPAAGSLVKNLSLADPAKIRFLSEDLPLAHPAKIVGVSLGH
jgi:hypothetical protein